MRLLDRFLFHLAPDIYNRRLALRHRDEIAPRLLSVWEDALRLPGTVSLEDSMLTELEEYFDLSRPEALSRLESGAECFARQFVERALDPTDAEGLERFYDESPAEAFELAEWHARRFHEGPVNYVLTLQAAREAGARRYLDYGSGIGSGAILFAREGFDVTMADVSGPLLAFARWRHEKRGLPHRTVYLRHDPLGDETWDVITVLDVLEHVADPVSVVAQLQKHLSRSGLMVIRTPLDDVRPQHIPHDLRTPSRFGALGYRYAWDVMARHAIPIVLRAGHRGPIARAAVGLIDDRVFGAASAALNLSRRARLRMLGRSRSARGPGE